jgi:serine/threonine protein phosphatase PrpC
MTSSPSPPTLRWSGMTDRGRVRKNNEDAFLALTFDATGLRYLGKIGEAVLDGADFVFAVSDGMGGANSGEYASRVAVEKITRLLPRAFRLGAEGLQAGHQDILDQLFRDIHAELTTMGRYYPECEGMGATLSLGWFTPGYMHFAHIGDSRIYEIEKEDGMTQITHDHTHVGWLRRSGKLNEREARTHPMRNVLSKALGAGHQFMDPQIGSVRVEPGDVLLFCTDGVTDGLWDRRLQEIVRERQPDDGGVLRLAQQIVEEAVASSGRDNATAVVVEVG